MSHLSSSNGNANGPKKRVAIIGGGPASLSAAFQLTQNDPSAYEITIFEMSFRLGGKTASGRGTRGRIEEHGLHILFGCYHDVFRTLLKCYDELRSEQLASPTEHRFQHLSDAIKPHHFGVIGDDRGDTWQPIYIQFPSNRGVPGDPPLPTLWDIGLAIFQVCWMVLLGGTSLSYLQRLLAPLFGYKTVWRVRDFQSREEREEQTQTAELGGGVVSRLALRSALSLLDNKTLLGGWAFVAAKHSQRALHRLRKLAFLPLLERAWSSLDFLFALFRGLSLHRVTTEPGGFRRIDAYDLRTWLHRHGATPETLASPWLRVIYDAAFSYPRGGLPPEGTDKRPPGLPPDGYYELIGAGAALRALMLMCVTYKGAYYNKMQAGMGDVIHTPLYLVLKHRGVKFEFFHRLVDVKPGVADGRPVIDELVFQCLPKPQAYDPLVPVEGLLCWPATAKLDALSDENHAWARECESYAPGTHQHGELKLSRAAGDFDAVLLGIPVACLPYACPSLLTAEAARPDPPSPSFHDQAQIDVVQTIALQIWLKPDLAGVGWPRPSPLLSLFLDPLNTWCDMSHLLVRESWGNDLRPKSVAYFCGALEHRFPFPGPLELAKASQLQGRINVQIRDAALDLLEKKVAQLWPSVDSMLAFDFSMLLDPNNGKGRQRFHAQYLRANHEPHALCTLALPKKTRFRMKPDGTGYDNLFVTGDWIDNDVHVACVEGAVQAGILGARELARHTGGQPELYRVAAQGLLNLEILNSKAKS